VKTLLIVLLLAGGAIVGYFWWHETRSSAAAEEPRTEKIVRGNIQEKITGSGKVDVSSGLYYVVSETDGKIASVMPGLTMGKQVKKDEVLIQLDDTLAQFRLKEAQSAVSAAQADIQRAKAKKSANEAQVNAIRKDLEFSKAKLERARREERSIAPGVLNEYEKEYEKNEAAAAAGNSLVLAADADITTAVATAAKAEAALNVARRGLEGTAIKSPSDGVVLSVNKAVKEGQLITKGMQPNGFPLVIIAENLKDWEVNAQISEQDIGRLQNRLRQGGTVPATFSVDAYSVDHIRFTGHVTSIAELPSIPQRASLPGLEALQLGALGGGNANAPATYTVTIQVDPIQDPVVRKNHPLKVGFVASDLQIIVDEFKDVVCVPSLALSFKPEGLSDAKQAELAKREDEGWSPIWFYHNGQYSERYIKAGASAEQLTQVRQVMDGKPEDLIGLQAVIEGPKRPEKSTGLFDNTKIKIPG